MAKLTVIVHTKNSAAILDRCLKSVKPLSDELLVVDMASTDNTRQIARSYGAKIIKHPDVGYVEPARNQAIKQASGDWILIIDDDEEISPDLSKHIKEVITGSISADAIALPRKNLIFGRWAKTGWWPDHQIRLFRSGTVDWPPSLHAQPIVRGEVQYMPSQTSWAIVHHNYDDLDDFIDRAQRYSQIAVNESKENQSKQELGSQNLIDVFFREYLRRWYAKNGYQEGDYGQTLSAMQAFFEMLVLAKKWEKINFNNQNYSSNKLSIQLKEFAKEARWWEYQIKINQNKSWQKWYWKLRRKLG